MPDPLRKLREAGLWRTDQLPTAPAARVLEHLLRPGPPEPRLFTGVRDGHVSSSVSNAAGATGFPTKVDLTSFHWGKWIELDQELTRTCTNGIEAYRITDAGAEALAQFRAFELLEKETVLLARRVLAECRRETNARRR
jgi:hypothetical protein